MKGIMTKIITLALSVVMIATIFAGVPAKEVKAEENKAFDICISANQGRAIDKDGNLWRWGYNDTVSESDIENPEVFMENVKQIAMHAGGGLSAALKVDGSLWMWGSNNSGALGTGTNIGINEPTPTKIMEDVVDVSVGFKHGAAVKTDGSLWMWGDNSNGQLGNGTVENSYTPIKIMDDVADVTLRASTSAVIKTDGSLWMWGRAYDGSFETISTPTKIMDDVNMISFGAYHIAVIKNDSSLWMWGENDFGQLGNGTYEESYDEPIKIMDNVKFVSLGNHHSGVIKEDGSLWMWGRNAYGQLGNGTFDDSYTPIKIMDDVVKISTGLNNSGVVKEDGSIWLWGENTNCVLGNVTTTSINEPVKFTIPTSLKTQTITAKNISKTVSSSARTVSIEATTDGNGKLTYKSNNENISVNSKGKVTIKKNYIGKATITITAVETSNYKKATKEITVTIKPVKATINSLKYASKKITLKNKKNIGGVKYQIQYATNSKFNSAKSKEVSYNKNGYTVLKNPTKGKTYYVRVRGYKVVNGTRYNGTWSGVKKLKISK